MEILLSLKRNLNMVCCPRRAASLQGATDLEGQAFDELQTHRAGADCRGIPAFPTSDPRVPPNGGQGRPDTKRW